MEISKMLTISTAQITEQTAKELDVAIGKADSSIDLCIYEKKNYGFFVHIPEDWEDGREIPADLMDCIRLAVVNDCRWLCLDRDGEIINELRVYEW